MQQPIDYPPYSVSVNYGYLQLPVVSFIGDRNMRCNLFVMPINQTGAEVGLCVWIRYKNL